MELPRLASGCDGAVSAGRRGDILVTSDPGDMQRFADDLPVVRVLGL
jgi:hypothetical protein